MVPIRWGGSSPGGSTAARGGRLVQLEPEPTDGLRRFDELVEIDRLPDVGIGAEGIAPFHILLLPRGGEDNDRKDPAPWVGPEPPQDLQAVDLRQLEVEE